MSVMPILYTRLACEERSTRVGAGEVRQRVRVARARGEGARDRVARVPPWRAHAGGRNARGAGRRARVRTRYASIAPATSRAAKYWMIVMATTFERGPSREHQWRPTRRPRRILTSPPLRAPRSHVESGESANQTVIRPSNVSHDRCARISAQPRDRGTYVASRAALARRKSTADSRPTLAPVVEHNPARRAWRASGEPERAVDRAGIDTSSHTCDTAGRVRASILISPRRRASLSDRRDEASPRKAPFVSNGGIRGDAIRARRRPRESRPHG